MLASEGHAPAVLKENPCPGLLEALLAERTALLILLLHLQIKEESSNTLKSSSNKTLQFSQKCQLQKHERVSMGGDDRKVPGIQGPVTLDNW